MKEEEIDSAILNGKPFKNPFTEDYLKGYKHGEINGIDVGRKQIIEELKRLLEIEN